MGESSLVERENDSFYREERGEFVEEDFFGCYSLFGQGLSIFSEFKRLKFEEIC